MTRAIKIALAGIVAAAVIAALYWSFLAHRAEVASEAQSDEPIKNAARVTERGGQTVVKFDRETQQRMGIRAEPVVAVAKRREVAAYGRLEEDPARSFVSRAPVAGTVQANAGTSWPDIGQTFADGSIVGAIEPRLPPADRITLSDRLASAKADAEAGRAALAAAQAAQQRARRLNADAQNVSDRVVQEADARVAAEQAHLAAATQSARLIEAALASLQDAATPLQLARGGEVVQILAHPGETVESGQPVLRVAQFDQLLARVDVPAGETFDFKVTAASIVPVSHEDHPLRGERIALAPAVDPKTQGQPFLFRVPNPSLALRPGLSVTAYLEIPGPARNGVVVPRPAVVRQSGQAWVYVQTAAEQFARRPVVLEEPAGQGWFTRSLSAGDRIVTIGAQSLLSEEFKSQIQVSEESQR